MASGQKATAGCTEFANERKFAVLLLVVVLSLAWAGIVRAQEGSPVRMVFFYRDDCPHCMTVIDEVLRPLQAEYGDRLEIKMVQYHDPQQSGEVDAGKYEMFIRAEEMFGVSAERRGIPTLIVGGEVLVGEDEIRERLRCVLESCLASAGTSWPDIPGLEDIPVGIGNGGDSTFVPTPGDPGVCDADAPVCAVGPSEIWLAYFYQAGCDECDRAWSDIQYLKARYPQLMVEEFDVVERQDLAQCLAERAGRDFEVGVPAPAVFIDKDVFVGPAEITPQVLESAVQKYASSGTGRFWEKCNGGVVSLPPWIVVVSGGLVDGLNPCAFATLIFFVSYLTVTERQGREILAVGAAFAFGVFATYLAIGLGLYEVVKSISDIHTALGYSVSLFIALLCVVLAALSFRDFFRARQGELKDMALVMPEGLRRFAHSVIRRTSDARAFVLVAFVTGAIISFIELACTGTPLLAVITYLVGNVPDSRVQAIGLLVLFSLMFILPLVVVFVLVYFGTTSLQLGVFLKRHAALVKLATAVLFIAMAIWLAYSAVPWLLGQILI
jgi:cytochrome c biogenesis protein CcdA/thiol-disulfide isomerase/thioredoxin